MPKTVLVVDNAAEYRDLLSQVVEAMGYASMQAGSATEAWRMLERSPVELILLDIKMPAIHGDLFLKYIRDKGCVSSVIAVSGYLTPGVLQDLKRYGIDRVIAKPFKVRRLTADIHEVIGAPDA